MNTYTNPVHPEQGFDPRPKKQMNSNNPDKSSENDKPDSDLESNDDNLDDGSGVTENPAVEESMD